MRASSSDVRPVQLQREVGDAVHYRFRNGMMESTLWAVDTIHIRLLEGNGPGGCG